MERDIGPKACFRPKTARIKWQRMARVTLVPL
jgi:hypothetical protein